MASRSAFKRKALSMTSLIDVIFLLLLFFMLSSTFSKFGKIDLVTSTSGASTSPTTPPVFVQRSSETITVNGEHMALEQAMETIARLQQKGAETVLLSIKEDLSSQILIETMVSISKAAPVRLTLVR